MTVAGKINALVIFISIAAGCLLTAHTIQREYSYARDQLLEASTARLLSQPQLQVSIYYRDKKALQETLRDFITSSRAVRYALILDPAGQPLSRRDAAGQADQQVPPFERSRGSATMLEKGLTHRHSQTSPAELSLLGDLGFGDRILDFTLPVFSVISPLEKGLHRSDFGFTLTDPGPNASQHVIGYLQLGISRSMLLLAILPMVALAIVVAITFIVICVLFSVYITRHITSPFAKLVKVADDIAGGRVDQSMTLDESGEFKEIVALLNNIISNLNTYKTKMDVDHQLLSMKVEERTAQLSRRNEELNKAVHEVTQTKDRLRQMAYYDSLTSLPNRRLFTEQLDLLLRLATRNKETMGLLFLDLDNFKRINDSLGHSAGDLLLREVAKRLSACVRDSDVVSHYVDSTPGRIDVSRLGGDEFTVVLNQLERAESAGEVAQRLINTLVEPMIIDGHELVVTPSIGIAIAPRDADNVEGLLKAADTAMYHAKASGKNNFLFYDGAMDAAGVDRLKLETDLRKAIERDELVLHYQPQVDTDSGSVVGAEALLRWEHPEQGLIPPFKFIPLAEEMGLISALGDWGLREACRQMIELQSLELDLSKISVNVSALQFNKAFVRRVGDILKETGLRPSRLELELTEGIMMDDTDTTVHALQELKDMGVQLSIDDFGTGYSSLSYLSRFPLDELKIDRSFVIDFDKTENDASLIIAIIAMARSLKLQLVAEGVETHEQYQFLTQQGAHVIQGFLFSKPVPADQLKPLLTPGYFRDQIERINAGG